MIGDAIGMATEPDKVSPEMQGKIDAYITAAMKVIHDDKTSPSIIGMLESGEPEKSVPPTVQNVTTLINNSIKNSGNTIDDSVKLAGMMYVTMDLMELGNVSGAFKRQLGEQDFQPIMQETLKLHIHEGLRDGSIDPVDLQAQTEPLLNEKQTQLGNQIAQEAGLPQKPTAQMGMDVSVDRKVRPLQQENEELKGLLAQQGQQQRPPQGQPQGGR